ncbi:pentatricopeptide repeat-containing protein [Trifolium medium]|uniref:Pentatricopeptide repeat-containing protein n=1 Tax=Trifolium medium TaxID=97028 RepID=A0A392N1A1_9FABA|nr:pentatricopeptide repeat-containing protein [Trifolium medium]
MSFLWQCKELEIGMKPHAISFIVEHYGCLVDILCRARHLEQAKSIIERMPVTVRPNKVIWISLLCGGRNHRNLEIGEYAACNLIEGDLDARTGCYTVLSNMHAAAGKWDKVSHMASPNPGYIYILREMRKKLKLLGHVPDTSQVLLNIDGEKEKEFELENQ